MKNDDFEKMDEFFEKETGRFRQREVPREILKGFSASVKAKIRERQIEKAPRRFGLPLWVPAFAVLLVVSVVALRGSVGLLPDPVSMGTSQIAEEIAVLQELGVWTDADDKTMNGTYESFAAEIEMGA